MQESQDVYCRVGDVLSAAAGGETILLKLPTAAYHGLDGIGTIVWNSLASPCGVRDLAKDLSGAFGIPVETAIADLQPFLDQLLLAGLIESCAPEHASEPTQRLESKSLSRGPDPRPVLEGDLSRYAPPRLESGELRDAAHHAMGLLPDGGHTPGGTCQFS